MRLDFKTIGGSFRGTLRRLGFALVPSLSYPYGCVGTGVALADVILLLIVTRYAAAVGETIEVRSTRAVIGVATSNRHALWQGLQVVVDTCHDWVLQLVIDTRYCRDCN